jgi:hypothetical protein
VLSYIVSALSVARHAVALTLVAGAAATTMVAGAVDQNVRQPEHQTAPLASIAPTGKPEPTAKAELTLSLSAKPATPETSSKLETSSKPQAKTGEIYPLVRDCLTTYAEAKTNAAGASAASEACRRAIEATGLSASEFWARFAPKAQPGTEPMRPATIEAFVKDCLAAYSAAKTSTTGSESASKACRRAIEASGLSAREFWAKFGTEQAPRPTPKSSTAAAPQLTELTRYCLTLRAALTSTSAHEQLERTTTVCNKAIAESKLTPTQFWAKFSAYR